jgi:predicted nicotinamide N-methyase
MVGAEKNEILSYGVRVFRSRHREIRKLKRLHSPSSHGFRVWSSSWLLLDFLARRRLPQGIRVIDIGCGWGVAGIYCAKQYGARVTAVDIDSEVFPYLRLHADVNKVKIITIKKGIDELRDKHLKDVDVVIGADICFWDTMVDSMKRFISRALVKGVRMVLIADPGRSPFEELGEYFVKDRKGVAMDWSVRSPHPIHGRILKIALPNVLT